MTTLSWPWFGGDLEVEVEFQSLDCSENQASSQYLGEHNIRNFNIWSDIATFRSAKAVINSLFKQSNGQKKHFIVIFSISKREEFLALCYQRFEVWPIV